MEHRKKFKGIKAHNADIIIQMFIMASLWTSSDQYRELYEYICESFDIDKDEKHYVKRSSVKKKTK